MPLTEQEEQVKDILLQYGITHLTHAVFPVSERLYVVDFFLPDYRLIVECWKSTSRRGVALTWVERNAAYVDLKFRRIKGAYPGVKCLGLVEVSQADPDVVAKYVRAVMEHADSMAYTMTQLGEQVRQLLGRAV